MNPNLLRALVVAASGALTALGQAGGVAGVPGDVFTGLAGILVGWLLPQLAKAQPAPQAPKAG